MMGSARIIRADSRNLPLDDNSVDLICTSPPYFGLRSYTDNGVHYSGQIGDEPTPQEFIDALLEVTRECVRVLKPTGSLFVNLGDKYSQRTQTRRSSHQPGIFPGKFEEFNETWAERAAKGAVRMPKDNITNAATGAHVPEKSLMLIPQRYAIACVDQLGLILRAEIIWDKPNGLPESVTDRVRRSHEQWWHFTLQPRYYSAVDNVREPHVTDPRVLARLTSIHSDTDGHSTADRVGEGRHKMGTEHPLGKLPGSVWTIPTQPLKVPTHLGVDHFAAFPMEWPRRIIRGWSPAGVCTACGEGRRPVVEREPMKWRPGPKAGLYETEGTSRKVVSGTMLSPASTTITGEQCACPDTTAPTTPGVVLDPFSGTGTTALVAKALGRHGIGVDMSADYCRLAEWRTTDSGELARAMQVDKPEPVMDGQLGMFEDGAA